MSSLWESARYTSGLRNGRDIGLIFHRCEIVNRPRAARELMTDREKPDDLMKDTSPVIRFVFTARE
jgi:hypothetical protein